MKLWLKTLFSTALAASFTNALALDAQQIFERVSPSIVVIKAGNSQGSGVVYGTVQSGLTPTTGILTNCHVVKGHTQVIVERLGKQSTGEVLACDDERDMAVIKLGGLLPTLPRRTTPLKVGEPAFAVGAPQGLELSISQGIVSQLRPTSLGADPMIQTTAAISKGSSGGGLFDGEGRLIGLTTLYYKDGQSLNFAVPHSFFHLLKPLSSASPPNRPVAATPSSSVPQQQCGWTLLEKFVLDNEVVEIISYYIDFCQITDAGRYRFAWILDDYKNARRSEDGQYSYRSQINKHVFDCRLSLMATTAISRYLGHMGKQPIRAYPQLPQNQWDLIEPPPGTIGATIVRAICN